MSGRVEHLSDSVTLYLGDCREVMDAADFVVDHVICDPPYEQISQDRIGGIKRNDGGKITEKLAFAGIDLIRNEITGHIAHRCRGWFLLFCTAEGVAAWRDTIEAHRLKYKTPMIWVKPDAMPKFNGQGPALGYENIVTAWCGHGHSSWNGGGKRGVFSYLTNDPNRHGVHPTEKPAPLMRDLVNLFSLSGQTILDPFMGSGTTGVACADMGRKFIGIEINERYFDIACRRIADALSRPRLALDAPAPAKQLNWDEMWAAPLQTTNPEFVK